MQPGCGSRSSRLIIKNVTFGRTQFVGESAFIDTRFSRCDFEDVRFFSMAPALRTEFASTPNSSLVLMSQVLQVSVVGVYGLCVGVDHVTSLC